MKENKSLFDLQPSCKMYADAVVGFILLSNVINSSLYVTKPDHVYQCIVTIDYDNTLNDTYPKKWAVMENHRDYCKINLEEYDDATVRFKIRYVFQDASQWLPTDNWILILSDTKQFESLLKTMEVWGTVYSIVFPMLFITIFIIWSCIFYLLKNK